jgi:hypothetical protein
MVVKALSVRQPWAFAIVMGFKPVENRDFTRQHRGPTLIHTGKNAEHGNLTPVLMQIADQSCMRLRDVRALYDKHFALGAIVGKVNIADCVKSHPSKWFFGPFGFVMTDAQWCEPFPWRGQFDFFEVPETVVSRLRFAERADATGADLFDPGHA